MLFEKFVDEVSEGWRKYFSKLSILQAAGQVKNTPGAKILYPNLILFTNCSGYYTCELLGASKLYVGLTVKRNKSPSIYRYLNQFDDGKPDPVIELSSNASFYYMALSQSKDRELISERFPSLRLYGTSIFRDNGHGSVFEFMEDFDFCKIDCCVLVNVSGLLHRCKHILHLMICRNSISSAGIARCYNSYFEEDKIKGISNVPDEEVERQVVAGQLQNVYLLKGLHETTVGEFFRLHPEIVHRAFGTDKFHYEPYLKWIEHDGTCEDEAINPDLLIRRPDGFYDIFDLKTSLLDKKNVTKGGRRRRRFIDCVEEGVAQLANYREYFDYQGNAEFAKEKYDIQVQSPNLVLVVGNWENSMLDEVNQACRRYPDVKVIDYDTLCHMFLTPKPMHVEDLE